ncbi:MAG: molybdopterin-dependent oxidoreductase [Anaerolineae bacterium]|nr:molybdopterin-dependent oxidoreductase [Anaerolineae bacterium]
MSDLYKPLTRREWLRLVALGAGSTILAACARAIEPLTPTPHIPAPTRDWSTIPITANQDFFTLSIRGTPPIPTAWELTITGLVERTMSFTLDEIKALPAVTAMRTLACISNPPGGDLIGNAVWRGVRLRDLLARAGIASNARYLKLESFDGFHTGIPLDLAMDADSLLVYEMNGEPLPRDHGAPLRCLFPGRYGMKQPKWLGTITVTAQEHIGFWEAQGWSNDAYVLPFSRIDAPKNGSTIVETTFTLWGVAFSGAAGLAKVEISWDDTKQWFPAELVRAPSPLAWSVWRWSGNALSRGQHTLYARATDALGKTQVRAQPFRIMESFPNGVDVMHSIILDFR